MKLPLLSMKLSIRRIFLRVRYSFFVSSAEIYMTSLDAESGRSCRFEIGQLNVDDVCGCMVHNSQAYIKRNNSRRFFTIFDPDTS